jgi:multisubunit Na+/H+ antiporter MnhE subunit
MPQKIGEKTAEFVVFFLLWMLFVSQMAKGEILAGIAAALVTVIALEASKHAEPLRFRSPLRALAQAWRIPGLVLKGTWTLVCELAARIAGRPGQSTLLLTHFEARGAGSRASAKRALAVMYVTFPPNSLIIGIDPESGVMLLHQVRREPVPEIIHRLESA